MQEQKDIISYILKEHILDNATLQGILKEQEVGGQSLPILLKNNNLINEEQFVKIIAVGNGIEFVNLSAEMIDPMAAHMVTYEIANKYNIIPIKKEGNKLFVAMSSPLNIAIRDEIEIRTNYKVVPLAATPDAIRQAITYHFNVQNVTRQAIASMRLKTGTGHDLLEFESKKNQPPAVSDAPITKLVSSIINGAIDGRASDIHIEPQEPDMKVRYRIDGILHEALSIPSSAQREVVSYIKVASGMDISERRLPQDGHMMVYHDEKEYDTRVSSLPGIGGEKIVIRILDKNASRWTLDNVVSNQQDNQKIKELISNPHGMLLMTGPTGSGKTTTLYSILQQLNTPDINIVTVEDPVEYRLDGITQLQVKPVAGLTFASALRSILRQDPDAILVGEIRDSETAEIAISAALTGHLVLSTLHTNDAAGAISRLINLGVAPFLVASALLGSIAQRLVRISCSRCKEPYEPAAEELEWLPREYYDNKKIQLYRPKGCNSCNNTGYNKRSGLFEILTVSPAIKKMITDAQSDEVIKQQAIKEGMKSLRKNAIEEVLSGSTTLDEMTRVIDMRTD